jgi:hypothetical protein
VHWNSKTRQFSLSDTELYQRSGLKLASSVDDQQAHTLLLHWLVPWFKIHPSSVLCSFFFVFFSKQTIGWWFFSNIFNTSESQNHSLVPVLLTKIGIKESSGSPPRFVISKTTWWGTSCGFHDQINKGSSCGFIVGCLIVFIFLRTMVMYQNWVFDFFGKIVMNPMNFAW